MTITMSKVLRLAAGPAAACTLASCAYLSTDKLPSLSALRTSAQQASATPTLAFAVETLKVADLASLGYSATGRWFQFGQPPGPNQPWPAFELPRYTADFDFRAKAARVQYARKQVVEPGRERPASIEQSFEQYVAGTYAWNVPVTPAGTVAPAPVPTPQPATLDERRADLWTTPQGFLISALAHAATSRPVAGGLEVSFTLDGKFRYVGLINHNGLVEQVQTWVDTPLMGDTLIETRYSGYKDFNGVPFPSRMQRSQGGHPVLDVQISEVRRNAVLGLAVPPNVASDPPAPLVVNSTKMAEGVYHLTGGTHHSVLIEQREHLVLVEAPLNEQRSLALIVKAKELVPRKSIKYLVNTHVHFDHAGGMRTFAGAGVIIVTQQANRPFYEQAWAAPRTLNPDSMSQAGKVARFETYAGKLVLPDGLRPIEIHEITNSGHNDAFSMVYLPQEKILIEADAYSPPALNAPPPSPPNPFSVNLYQNIVKLKLDVLQIAALHGPRVATLADLRAAIGNQAAAPMNSR